MSCYACRTAAATQQTRTTPARVTSSVRPRLLKGQVHVPRRERGRHCNWEDDLSPYGIKRFGSVRVAFIGMTLRETPTIVTPTGVGSLQFKDEADTVNTLIPRLRERGVAAIVVLLHQGGRRPLRPARTSTPVLEV